MIILKLFIILIFLWLSSKCFGILLNEKTSISYETSLGVGYLANIAIYFLCAFIPMYFRLSTMMLLIFSIPYFIICFLCIGYSIKTKKILKFTKKEIVALCIGLVFTILFAIFVDFGYAEMYDSYFYSILSNSSSNANHLARINPYNGISDLQNFYKYLSFYYQSGMFSKLFSIKHAYLILIWPYTFMTYYFLGLTSMGIVRISKKEYINNIISVFMITVFTTFFRAPFNALYMVNVLVPIYMLYFMFKSMEDKKNIIIYYFLFVATAACSSAILYTSVTGLCALFIASCYRKNYDKIENIFLLAIPTYLLGSIYVLEAHRSIINVLLAILVLVVLYFILKIKQVRGILKYIGMALLLIIPVIFIVVPRNPNVLNYKYLFMNQGVVDDKLVTTTSNACIPGIVHTNNLNYTVDYNIFGTAMKYIYQNSHTIYNTGLIMLTYSIFLYGGLLFFFIYGFFKHRKEHIYLTFIVYLFLFFNPFVSKGLAMLTLDLNGRIYLYFNYFFAIYGLKWFFEWVEEFNWKYVNAFLKKAYIPYIIFVCLSVASYIALLKQPNFNKINLLYKVPNNLVKSNNEVNKITSKKINSMKPTVFYSLSTLNLSMLDSNPNDNYKLIDSKEYKSYYADTNVITNKMLINLYFSSNGKMTFDKTKNHIIVKKDEVYNIHSCDINKMLKSFKVAYIVISKQEIESYEGVKKYYKIAYDKNNIVVLKRINDKV